MKKLLLVLLLLMTACSSTQTSTISLNDTYEGGLALTQAEREEILVKEQEKKEKAEQEKKKAEEEKKKAEERKKALENGYRTIYIVKGTSNEDFSDTEVLNYANKKWNGVVYNDYALVTNLDDIQLYGYDYVLFNYNYRFALLTEDGYYLLDDEDTLFLGNEDWQNSDIAVLNYEEVLNKESFLANFTSTNTMAVSNNQSSNTQSSNNTNSNNTNNTTSSTQTNTQTSNQSNNNQSSTTQGSNNQSSNNQSSNKQETNNQTNTQTTSQPTQTTTQTDTQSSNTQSNEDKAKAEAEKKAQAEAEAKAKAEEERLAEERRKEVAEYERVSQFNVFKATCFIENRYTAEDVAFMREDEDYRSLYSDEDFDWWENHLGFYHEITIMEVEDNGNITFDHVEQQCIEYISEVTGGKNYRLSYHLGGGSLTDEAKLRYGY